MELQLVNGRPVDIRGRLEKEIRTYDLLDELGIVYERVDHEEANTMEACAEIDALLAPAVICNNFFLCNTQNTKFYLLMIKYMEEFLDITPGSVSVMGLMNDTEKHVQLLVDEDVLKGEYFGCHPCINTSSMRLKVEDVFHKFLPAVEHDYIMVKLIGEE